MLRGVLIILILIGAVHAQEVHFYGRSITTKSFDSEEGAEVQILGEKNTIYGLR